MRWSSVAITVWLLPLTVAAQAPIHIDFDDLTAPCDLGSALPLRQEYLDLGIEFLAYGYGNGGAAVLDECSGLGVPGYSPPNFAVIDPQGVLANGGVPDRMFFIPTGPAPTRVQVRVGGTPGTTVWLACGICPWAVPGCSETTVATLGTGMQTLEVSTVAAFPLGCEVYLADPGGRWIVDDLELYFQQRAAPIPTLSGAGVAAYLALIALAGGVLVRFARH
jgi:hypothetical protein